MILFISRQKLCQIFAEGIRRPGNLVFHVKFSPLTNIGQSIEALLESIHRGCGFVNAQATDERFVKIGGFLFMRRCKCKL